MEQGLTYSDIYSTRNEDHLHVIRVKMVQYAIRHSIKAAQRAFGVSRNTVRLWLRRYREDSQQKLHAYRAATTQHPKKMLPFVIFELARIVKEKHRKNQRIIVSQLRRRNKYIARYSTKTILKHLRRLELYAHKNSDFGSLFLAKLKEYLSNISGSKICKVKREQQTDEGRCIDIFIETDSGEAIVIENKIWAGDQSHQLIDYYEWANEQHPEKAYVVYLTLEGEDPSEDSIPPDCLEKLKQSGRYTNLSYSNDIPAWLCKCENASTHKFTTSGITQLQDAIQGLCNGRTEHAIWRKIIMQELMNEFKNILQAGKRTEIAELLNEKRILSEAITKVSVIQFLIDVHAQLQEHFAEQQLEFAFTIDQERCASQENWLQSLKHDSYFGVELILTDSLGIGLEFYCAKQSPEGIFGFMAHFTESNKRPYSIAKPGLDKLLEIGRNKLNDSSDFWWHWANVPSWAIKKICEDDSSWQTELSLSEHIAKYWFAVVYKSVKLKEN